MRIIAVNQKKVDMPNIFMPEGWLDGKSGNHLGSVTILPDLWAFEKTLLSMYPELM